MSKKKIEVKRQNVFVDMTAMCDMAFLLLTFFILTAKFRPNEPVVVETPASRSEIPIPEKNIMLISVGTEGQVFMGIDDQQSRVVFLQRMGEKYGFQVDDQMAARFALVEQFGVNPAQLPQFLKLSGPEMGKFEQPGIQMPVEGGDTTNVLRELIFLARSAHQQTKGDDNALRIAIKADKTTNYDKVDGVIKTLVDSKINRFNLITSAKTGSNE
jgi:biopolymer transport protein ExbD